MKCEKIIRLVCVAFFCVFTFLVYAPLEMYLTNISEFEERPEFPSFRFTATTSLSDYVDSVDDAETDNSKLTDQERLQKIEHTIRVIKKCLGKEVEDVFGVTYTKQVK